MARKPKNPGAERAKAVAQAAAEAKRLEEETRSALYSPARAATLSRWRDIKLPLPPCTDKALRHVAAMLDPWDEKKTRGTQE